MITNNIIQYQNIKVKKNLGFASDILRKKPADTHINLCHWKIAFLHKVYINVVFAKLRRENFCISLRAEQNNLFVIGCKTFNGRGFAYAAVNVKRYFKEEF